MNRDSWAKLKRKFRKIQALIEFERNLEEVKMQTLVENKKSLLYDEKVAAMRLGIGYSTLRWIRQKGKISYVRVGKRVLYRVQDIERFIESRAVEAGP